MEICTLAAADADAFWALRLRSMREHPESYGWSYEELRDTPIAAVRRGFVDEWCLPESFVLGAFDAAGQLVGMLGLRREVRQKWRHKAVVRSVYVVPEARGRGISKALLTECVNRAKALPGLEQLYLSVGTYNTPARSLYASFGFESFGVEPRALKLTDRYVDEELMVLHLEPVDERRTG